jgi:hypothetical protein
MWMYLSCILWFFLNYVSAATAARCPLAEA